MGMERINDDKPQRNAILKTWILLVFVALIIIILALDRIMIGNASTPRSRLDDPLYAKRYKDKEILIQKCRHSARLLFVGDSIFQQFEESKPMGEFNNVDVCRHYYCDRNALELGFFGDTTANLLWRIQNGEMDGLSPSVIVLLDGINNLAVERWSWDAASTVQGIDEVVRELHSHLPGAHVLLLGILPLRGHESGWIRQVDYLWKTRKITKINSALDKQFGHGNVPYVTYVDLTDIFMKEGQIDTSLLADRVHPNPQGRALMALALEPYISRYLGDMPKGPTVTHISDRGSPSPCGCGGIP
jgi:lysophospholipase L1-like esterase